MVDKDEYLIHVSRYIHLNPIALFNVSGTNIFNRLLQYRWSSLPNYLSGVASEIVDPMIVLSYFSNKNPTKDYKEFVASNIRLEVDPIIDHLKFEEI